MDLQDTAKDLQNTAKIDLANLLNCSGLKEGKEGEKIWGFVELDSQNEDDGGTLYFNETNYNKKTWEPFRSEYGTMLYTDVEIKACLNDCCTKEITKVIRAIRNNA